jgi:MFS family permease
MTETDITPPGDDTNPECPLEPRVQVSNLVFFAMCTGMQYLAAPVLYVGITQASLCKALGADARVSNLPATMFFALTAVVVLVAWLSPGIGSLRRNLSICYASTAVMLLVTAVVLAMPVANEIKIGVVILQGAVSGAAGPTAIALLWEMVGRGSDERRRGMALGLAFGAGPVLAVVGSFGQTLLLGGKFFGLEYEGLDGLDGFVVLFACGVPVMAVAAILSWSFRLPEVLVEPSREPIASVLGLLVGLPLMVGSIGLMQVGQFTDEDSFIYAAYAVAALSAAAFVYHFRPILTQRVLLVATVVTVLVYSGNTIPSNMNLFTSEVLGDEPARYAGMQNALRFGFKVIAGAVLGWLLTRSHPRLGLVATAAIFLFAQLWAIFATGTAYLVAFGLYGAGELIGVYAPNYILSASRPGEIRRNMAFVTLLMVPAAPTGYLFGSIAQSVKDAGWQMGEMTSAALGFRISFVVCAVLILSGIVVALVALPRQPERQE